MKTKRLKRIKLTERACYHVISRITERRFYLGESEKNVFCDMLERAARFSGVNILTYCIMDNHFHILVEVPERKPLTLKEIQDRLPLIYRGEDLKRVLQEFKQWEARDNQHMVDELKQQYERRMFDLSEFMKTLKQRFSIWYNRTHGDRKGTLWEGDRFISVLVQSRRRKRGDMGNLAIMTMAAYIELNPVRAGIVNDPKNYHWCGYGAANAGNKSAQVGIEIMMGFLEGKSKEWSVASRGYGNHIFVRGARRRAVSCNSRQDVLEKRGILSRSELLYCRIRYFTSGMVIGAEDYVSRIVSQNNECFRPTQKTCLMEGGNWEGLCAGKNCR